MPLTVLKPSSSAQSLAMMQESEQARLVAGGTALQLEWARGLLKPPVLISLNAIAGLSGISFCGGGMRIGSATTLAALCREPLVMEHLPLLAAASRSVAAPSVRNLGTLGGNIAARNGCLLPALLALDAIIEGERATGRFHERSLDWLQRPPERCEVIEAVYIGAMAAVSRWTHRKIGLRAAFTPSVIGVAASLDIRDGRIVSARLAVGGGSVAPARLRVAEELLASQPVDTIDWTELKTQLSQEISAPDDAFRSARYRKMAAANALVWGLQDQTASKRQTSPDTAKSAGSSGEIRLSRADQPSRWHVRPDVAAKVDGTFSYLTDRREEDMLVGRILRAGVAHARIRSIDTSAAEALDGVAAVVTHRDIAGQNAFGIVVQDQPAFCFDKVRYVGDVVAAVAAVDAATADAALALIKVDSEPLPVVDDPAAALEDGATVVHQAGNLQRVIEFGRGDVDQGFAAATHILERTYTTSRQMHGFMETEGGYATIDADGTLAIFVGGQHGARDRLQLSRILAMDEGKIRVVTSPTGGAFGGKDELTVQPALALLALKSRRPVRIQLSRAESVIAGVKRHPMTIRMRTACDGEGRLLAQEVDVLADAGAYASLGSGVLETALEHAAGPYLVDNVRTRGRLAYTNNGVGGAFRGFGANQMTYAIECQMDELAKRCGITPAEIRRRNLRSPGLPGYLGQVVAPSERLSQMLSAATASELWRRPDSDVDAEEIVGVGMALNYQGNGLGSAVPDPAGGALRLNSDGMIEAAYGLDEMGQGLLTSIQAAVSAQMGCARNDVLPVVGDTRCTPDSGSTTASRGGYVVWEVARTAGPEFSRRLLVAAAALLARSEETLKIGAGGLVEAGSNSGELLLSFRQLAQSLAPDALPSVTVAFDFPKTDYQSGNARYIFAFGACLARVAISRVTGAVRVLDIHQHTAAGPVIDVAAYLGQMEGGAIQGLGFTLTEDAIMAAGEYVTKNLDSYMLPSVRDTAARISVFALEDLDPGDTLGPRGAGELGIGAITPAIANAVADAIGHFPTSIPVSPKRVLDVLEAGR
ncbi:molybdopterin cofactor-binding domain-containing protein [Rhizobium sp. Root708]|uniref:molybdopterin cofactor-binding domain-containing protein n=1 Tax=Rhizobium sp. Root708 TaxID=1736592 RepID=UPI0009EB4791|nr:molybdopterin cofactor-binding domain-containing protein [Rhizobium sp. Root708]